jgi:exopolysaccharide biosynthesis WecB/TagA/CpsF family protein
MDVAVLLISYIAAFLLRYCVLAGFYSRAKTMDGLYVTLGFLLIAANVAITFIHNDGWKVPPNQTRGEVVITVLKMQIYMLVVMVLYTFLAKWGTRVSRSLVGYFFVLNTALDIAARMWYRSRIRLKTSGLKSTPVCLLITERDQAEILMAQLAGRMDDTEIRSLIWDGKYLDIPKGEFVKALISLPDATQKEIFEVVRRLEKNRIPSEIILTVMGDRVGRKNLAPAGGFQTIAYTGMLKHGNVLGVNYTISTISEAVFYIRKHLKELAGQYVCFSNVHTTVMSYDRDDVREAENSSALTFPDGAPIARILRHEADVGAVRMPGPDFMAACLEASMDGKTTHFFYGSTQETLDALRANLEKKYPGLNVKGYYSPPFRKLSDAEEQEMIDMINKADPDIIWIGLGAPKQEMWMLAHKGCFRGVMMGVGAAFDFHAGTIRRAPVWVQMLGLEWFHRLLQDPVKLFKRYFITNFRFLWLLATGKNRH